MSDIKADTVKLLAALKDAGYVVAPIEPTPEPDRME